MSSSPAESSLSPPAVPSSSGDAPVEVGTGSDTPPPPNGGSALGSSADRPGGLRTGLLVVAAVLIVAVAGSLWAVYDLRRSQKFVGESIREAGKRGAQVGLFDCVDEVLALYDRCDAAGSLCEEMLQRLAGACLGARPPAERVAECEMLPQKGMGAQLGYADCRERAWRRAHLVPENAGKSCLDAEGKWNGECLLCTRRNSTWRSGRCAKEYKRFKACGTVFRQVHDYCQLATKAPDRLPPVAPSPTNPDPASAVPGFDTAPPTNPGATTPTSP